MLAKHLDSLGYRVFAGCLDAEGEGARQLRKTSSDIVVVQLDVTSDKQVAHAREFVVAAMMNINWLGTVRVTKAFLPLVRAARGRVINLASLAGRVALPGFTSYSSSKFAVIGFSDSLRREMKKFGVRVITIEPSLYRTAIADREALTRQNVHMWGEAAPEVRKQYGESYFRCYLAKLAYVLRYASENVHEVVEDLTHAVSAARPYNRYVPGLFFNQLPADTFILTSPIAAAGDVIQYGNGKSVDTVTSHLAQRLFDQVPAVRKAVTKVVGSWLLDLPDRYSFHHKLVPLLLTSITDEQPDICELADSLWHDVGIKFEQENEDDFKDKQDFVKPAPIYYPPDVERPNLGCRTLVNRHASKILPGLMRDICDWVLETRIKSAQLLKTLLINLEEYTTQHIELLLTGMYKASIDEERRVVADVEKSAELTGYFVEPDVWCKLVLTGLRMSHSHGNLLVIAALIRGSQVAKLIPHVTELSQALLNPDICQSIQAPVQIQLLACAEALIMIIKSEVTVISQQLFDLIITVTAMASETVVKEKAWQVLGELSSVQNQESRTELFKRHTKPLLQSFGDGYVAWTNHSPERQIFDTLVLEAGLVVGELLDEVFTIFKCCLKVDKDPEMRLKFFALLSKLVMNSANPLDSQQQFGRVAPSIVKDIILPNCVWKAGRTAGAIRTTAVSCLWALLQSGVLTKESLAPMAEDLVTQITTTMDDDNKSTRLISCRVMTRTFETLGSTLDQDQLHNLYPELLKRLDDSSDDIRVTVSCTFLAYFDCFQDKYDRDLYGAHLEAIYKGLLVHLDDPEQKIQEAVLSE
nr:hypothetical protein BaRGS_024642 [Batillaria attramentaria]